MSAGEEARMASKRQKMSLRIAIGRGHWDRKSGGHNTDNGRNRRSDYPSSATSIVVSPFRLMARGSRSMGREEREICRRVGALDEPSFHLTRGLIVELNPPTDE